MRYFFLYTVYHAGIQAPQDISSARGLTCMYRYAPFRLRSMVTTGAYRYSHGTDMGPGGKKNWFYGILLEIRPKSLLIHRRHVRSCTVDSTCIVLRWGMWHGAWPFEITKKHVHSIQSLDGSLDTSFDLSLLWLESTFKSCMEKSDFLHWL